MCTIPLPILAEVPMNVGENMTAAIGAVQFASPFILKARGDTPIKIGVDGPFTGGSSSMGVSMRDGVRLATDEINKAGGVLGRQLVLVVERGELRPGHIKATRAS